MAVFNLSKKNVLDALEWIDRNGGSDSYRSDKYILLSESGQKYPLAYVISVADRLANGVDLSPDSVNEEEAKGFLESLGFLTRINQPEKYELTITATQIVSTDKRFTMNDLNLGNGYLPLDASFEKANGEIVKRIYNKGERKHTNQTLPRLAFQVFEQQIKSLPAEERERFPVCQYHPGGELICGIYPSVAEYKKHRNTIEYLVYGFGSGQQFVIYCWNIFTTLIFVQECLKRFGEPGDQFILTYREKEEKETVTEKAEAAAREELVQQTKGYRNPYSKMLVESKNMIFRGAPGTGKSYLAREIAADIVSDGYYDDYTLLSEEQKQQVEFVQFHPSYDYSDFVEGLRPKSNLDGSMGFELKDGVFKKFVARARKNYEDSLKSREAIEKEMSVQEAMEDFFAGVEMGVDTFRTINGSVFTIDSVDESHICVSIPANASVNKLAISTDEVRKMLESGQRFEKIKDITAFFGKTFATQAYSYDYAIYNEILKKKESPPKKAAKQTALKKYIFIIDEINRGEISKIFGELFFSIDPGYRGRAGELSTQYSNLHTDPNEKFYIPENVYILGTMNDIDRSVDSFDFAMRRRFRFVEIRAEDRLEMLDDLENEEMKEEAKQRMEALNRAIAEVEGLNENYQIGASYFLKLKTQSFDQLWTDYLCPLLQEYLRGMYNEKAALNRLAQAYGYRGESGGDGNESGQNQG